MELWREIPGWEGCYEVSDHGNVRSVDRTYYNSAKGLTKLRGRPLKPRKRGCGGHLGVCLSRPPLGAHKDVYIHWAVLTAFVGPRPEAKEACHRDGNPANNHVENLYWGTRSENMADRIRHGADPQARQTHCKWGHPFDEANTYKQYSKNPTKTTRGCKECRLQFSRRSHAKRREKDREYSREYYWRRKSQATSSLADLPW